MPKETLEGIKALVERELAKGVSPTDIAKKYGSAIGAALSSEYARSGYPIENGRIDLHAWCLEEDGAIWDPDFPEYRVIKARLGIPEDAPRLYEELTGKLKKSTWASVWKQIIKPKLGGLPEHGKQQLFKTLAQNPVYANCMLNAWAYSQVTGARFTIGKMGWRGQDGICWEFG